MRHGAFELDDRLWLGVGGRQASAHRMVSEPSSSGSPVERPLWQTCREPASSSARSDVDDPGLLQSFGYRLVGVIQIVMLPQMNGYSFEELLTLRIPIHVGTTGNDVVTDVFEHLASSLRRALQYHTPQAVDAGVVW
ncbi:MAG TPA: hypothetical protein VGB33_08885 [Acidimicrobiia bacterium]